MKVDILDSAALQRLESLESSISPWPEVLASSPDSQILTSFARRYYCPHTTAFVVSWDLQTGGVVSAIDYKGPCDVNTKKAHITYVRNGKMVEALSQYASSIIISIYDVISGVHIHDADQPAYKIWTHGESLRFATLKLTRITNWRVGLAP